MATMGKVFIFKTRKRILASVLAIIGIVVVPEWYMIITTTTLFLITWLPKSSYQWTPNNQIGTWAYGHPAVQAFLKIQGKEFSDEEKRLLGIGGKG